MFDFLLISPETGKDKEAQEYLPVVFKSTISSIDKKWAEVKREERGEGKK